LNETAENTFKISEYNIVELNSVHNIINKYRNKKETIPGSENMTFPASWIFTN